MRAVIQRVNFCTVIIDNKEFSKINKGILVLLGIAKDDTQQDIQWLAKKIVNLRIFNDQTGKMNKSLLDIDGEIMIVSQFTLFASTKKGTRPSYSHSAPPEIAIPLYNAFIEEVKRLVPKKVQTGLFGAYMKLKFENDGPVTICIDTKNKE